MSAMLQQRKDKDHKQASASSMEGSKKNAITTNAQHSGVTSMGACATPARAHNSPMTVYTESTVFNHRPIVLLY